MHKNTIRIFFVLSLLCALLSCSAFAAGEVASGHCGDQISWSLDHDGILTLRGSGPIRDYSDNNSSPWSSHRYSITGLIIEEGITRIGSRAFSGCRNLEYVEIGPDVTTIGERAFQNCYALSDVKMSCDIHLERGSFRNTPAEPYVIAAQTTLYTGSSYDTALSQVVITGDYREDIINIAMSQLGYHEGDSPSDYDGHNTNGSDNYTEYGRALDSAGRGWCSEFASWCIRMAGVPTQIVANSRGANVSGFTEGSSAAWYTWDELSYADGSYTPRKGDILLWAWDEEEHSTDEDLSHTSIFRSAESRTDGTVILNTIDGNSNDQVRERSYTVRISDGALVDRVGRLCYLIAPNYENSNPETYRVSFHAENGNCAVLQKNVPANGIYGALPEATRDGDTFLGWFTHSSGGSRVTPYTPTNLTANQTLYARWASDFVPYISGTLGKNGEISWTFDKATSLLTVTGTTDLEGTIYAAGYDSGGKMCFFSALSKSGQSITPNSDCTTIKLFLLDQFQRPQCVSAQIQIPR